MFVSRTTSLAQAGRVLGGGVRGGSRPFTSVPTVLPKSKPVLKVVEQSKDDRESGFTNRCCCWDADQLSNFFHSSLSRVVCWCLYSKVYRRGYTHATRQQLLLYTLVEHSIISDPVCGLSPLRLSHFVVLVFPIFCCPRVQCFFSALT